MEEMLIGIIVTILIILLIAFVYEESTGFRVVNYDIKTEKKISRDLKIVFLSDLHDTNTDCFFDRFKKDDFSKGKHKGANSRLLNAIDCVNPDFVLLAGDMITSYMQPKYNSDVTFDFLKELSENYEVYYGPGNHEQRYLEDKDKFGNKYEELKAYSNSLGIHFLDNDMRILKDENVAVYGLLIPMEFYRRVVTKHFPEDYVTKSLGAVDEDRFNILLAHNPDHFEDYVKYSPDLILCGHVHGGIVGLPGVGGVISPQLKLFPKYDFGEYRKNNSTMILSRGIGWHTIPVRIFNKAEIVVINISNK